ncbi:MAG: deoxyhypusine synthase family protein [Gammaproteobacteria bacterium]|nr:deoxyhypusine synthase family protein [Gammaproteobacteria bacterium]
MTDPARRDLLCRPVEHVDICAFDARPVIDQFRPTAIQARNLARAADICSEMLADRECTVILTLAGSLVSAGLKKALVTLIDSGMVDVVVSTGANMVDQDFFEALGFRHYMAPGSPEHPVVPDERLRELAIDRIYDTYIDERELRDCDRKMRRIFDRLPARPYSSREILTEMGRFLDVSFPESESVVLSAYRKGVPVFVPALSDSSAGFGIVLHQAAAAHEGRDSVSLDSGRDFLELARIKLASRASGLLMLGGGVPKNFAQDIVVAAEMLHEEAASSGRASAAEDGTGAAAATEDGTGTAAATEDGTGAAMPAEVSMHRYAVQLTVADSRDGALSGSTLREATSWGKVESTREQMVFCEATLGFALLASDAWHRRAWEGRPERRFADWLEEQAGRGREDVPAGIPG